MSLHFVPGAYEILQSGLRVGHLVAEDAPAVVEHWFLYRDVVTTTAYTTYTAPGQGPATGPSPGKFAQDPVAEWTFKALPPVSGFNVATYRADRFAELVAAGAAGSLTQVVYISASEYTCGSSVQPEQPPVQYQIAWGQYTIYNQAVQKVGTVDVLNPPGNTENWKLAPPGGAPGFSAYVPPSVTALESTTYTIKYFKTPPASPEPAILFCVSCSLAGAGQNLVGGRGGVACSS